MPAKVQETILHGLGLVVLVIGVIMATGTGNVLKPLVSVRVATLLPSIAIAPLLVWPLGA